MKTIELQEAIKSAADGCNSGAVFSMMFSIIFVLLSVVLLVIEYVGQESPSRWLSAGVLGYSGGMALVFFVYYLLKKRELRELEQSMTVVRPLP